MKKRILITAIVSVLAMVCFGQQPAKAKKILDKTAAALNAQGGASANFTMQSDGVGSTSGTIAIKGNKFRATTPEASTWYNGTTQWTYMKKTEEVNVSDPDERQQSQLNPYKFITMYKSGYRLGVKDVSGGWEVHLKALNMGRSIQEMYINVSNQYLPTKVRIREGQKWSTITISNFRAGNQSDDIFTFPAKDYPDAEIIDLR
ncbi:MAG: outer-membrane lipoprotein carrier protein LolA [Prevotella sp.]|nr:outer-membrane lipoprotein carrier protein LolA [Prevotella sp.]